MTTRERNQILRRLDPLVGDWEIRVFVDGQQIGGSGRTTFRWLDGDGILVQHADADIDDSWGPEWVANSPLPTMTAIGLDDRTETFYQLYSDARGVCRIYRMSLDDGIWRIWGQAAAEFHQRFEGRFSADGSTIEAYWEKSTDGETWERDFDTRFTKVT